MLPDSCGLAQAATIERGDGAVSRGAALSSQSPARKERRTRLLFSFVNWIGAKQFGTKTITASSLPTDSSDTEWFIPSPDGCGVRITGKFAKVSFALNTIFSCVMPVTTRT